LSSNRTGLYLHHILGAIEAIEAFTQGMSFEHFRTDPKTIAAVERKLLTISEAAAKRLGGGGGDTVSGSTLAQNPGGRKLAAPSV
jgi:hypothetical protein